MNNTEFKLIGKLSNVELSTSKLGNQVATCIVSAKRETNQGIETIDDFKVVAFKSLANQVSFFPKDNNVIIFGHLNANNYQGHYNTELVAENITTLN